ncbi:unnamed protein product, partial [Prorocentrum cordatum]
GEYGSNVKLPRNDAAAAQAALDSIDQAAWNQGAGIRVSYAIFNKELQRVLASELEVEFRPSGTVIPVQKTRIFLWMPINDIMSWLYPFILCVAFVGYSIINVGVEIYQMTSDWKAYVSNRAEMFDILRDFIHVLIIALMITVTVKQASLDLQPASDNVYVDTTDENNLIDIAYYSIHLQKLFGFTFFLQTFNLIRILRLFPELGPQMQAIGQTLVDGKVMQFFAFLFFCIVGCALTVNTVFGAEQKGFATLQDSLFAMYRFVWGDWDFAEIQSKEYVTTSTSIWGYLIFWILTFVITGTLANVFIAIVGERYTDHLGESMSDWIEEVDRIMANWYGDAFRRKMDNEYKEVAKSMKDWGVRDEDEDSTPKNSTADLALAASVDKVNTRQMAQQKRMDAIDDKLEDLKEMLQELLQQHGPTVTASV